MCDFTFPGRGICRVGGGEKRLRAERRIDPFLYREGVDRGADLYSLGMLGWLGIATLPLGLAAALLYILVVLIVYLVMRFRRKKALKELT